ncbi:MAG: DUF4062 domain-containing protein [Flavobacteriales bacterium]|nr:DUF4062 domain-containing protein [Flavobacteriales bacterium]
MAIIKTPDQRVRVFISSTINELADERRAAREAITNLRLIPVFFEAGARPHPPRDLYSAYLDQSHIFLGIYWNSYGWVAPGAEISGLEDEYRLCGDRKPKLIYVKRSNERQERLHGLLQDIERSETACYQHFTDAEELRGLIENDLSVLMSESFENALFQQQQPTASATADQGHHRIDVLPRIRSEIIGREDDLQRVDDLLRKPDTSLVTLLGAGGTGKTTLSIHIGHRAKEHFNDGIAFVQLATVTDHRLVAAAIADVLDLQDSGKQALDDTLAEYLSDKQLLLILDNFEQITDAATLVGKLLDRCKDLKVLVTSRTSLHLRHERLYHLSTLGLPEVDAPVDYAKLQEWPATRLFVERALEVNPAMALDRDNAEAIIDICRRMDGLPLAIELAAARTRFFQPAALLARIGKTLDLVNKGHKDLPERQRTLRGAIEWSYRLLTEDTQRVFRQLGLFRGSWTMEAADAVLANEDVDIEEMVERLLDVSLIKPETLPGNAEPRFSMLQTVHEYALEMLDAAPEAEETRRRFAGYYLRLIMEMDGKLWLRNGDAWLDVIEHENANIREAFQDFCRWGEWEQAWRFIPNFMVYWINRGGFSEATQVNEASRIHDKGLWELPDINPRVKARALIWTANNHMFQFRMDQGFELLEAAARVAEANGDEASLGEAIGMAGCYGCYVGHTDAGEKIERGTAIVSKHGDKFMSCMMLLWSGEHYRQQGRMDIVLANLDRAERIAEEEGMIFILATSRLMRFGHQANESGCDWQRLAREARALYTLLPPKGYQSAKSSAKQVLSYALLRNNDPEAAAMALRQGLEHARHAGESETELNAVAAAAVLFAVQGDASKAIQLLGVLDATIEAAAYPLIGIQKVQYAHLKEAMGARLDGDQEQQWYADGKRMGLAEAIVLALHG